IDDRARALGGRNEQVVAEAPGGVKRDPVLEPNAGKTCEEVGVAAGIDGRDARVLLQAQNVERLGAERAARAGDSRGARERDIRLLASGAHVAGASRPKRLQSARWSEQGQTARGGDN